MKKRYQRGIRVALVLAGVGIAAALMLRAFDENILYFYTPVQVVAGEAPDGRRFRLGGLVTLGSIEREPGSLKVSFLVTDNQKTLPVEYEGVLPDLFRDGQGVIAHGTMNDNGIFVADEVLAKHDENYMPPEVAEALEKVHGDEES
ncbi:MAG: cytochrome c maturation protein CcmE [Gammaproteobacteria bacterium]